MNKNVLIPVGLVVALLVVGGLVVLQRNAAGPGPGAPAGQTASSGSTNVKSGPITVTMTEWKYDPSVIHIKTGQPVVLKVKNIGKVIHSLASWQLTVDTGYVNPGETREYKFTAPGSPGLFQFNSTVPGQKEQGMTGTFSVEGKDLNAVAAPAANAPGATAKPTGPAPYAFSKDGFPLDKNLQRLNITGPDGKALPALKIDSQGYVLDPTTGKRVTGPDNKPAAPFTPGPNGVWLVPQPTK